MKVSSPQAPGRVPSPTPPSRRSRTEHARLERARRQRQRFLPLAGGLVILLGLVVVVVTRGAFSSHSVPATTLPSVTTTTAAPYTPPPIKAQVAAAGANEGQWVSRSPWVPGTAAVLETTWHPFPSNPGVTAYGFWMRAESTLLGLFPGYKGPGRTTLDRGPEQVPLQGRRGLLATFNSGFYIDSGDAGLDSPAGFYTNHVLYYPMRTGLATVVQKTDGTTDVLSWGGGTSPGEDIITARQNLPMLVENAQPTGASTNNTAFGVTIGNASATWRTGLGVDAKGNLIYVTAPELTAAGLAQVLVEAGAVRGMQLDINPAWPIYNTYSGPDAAGPVQNVPNSQQVPWRFLSSSTKDFFALYLRSPGVLKQPW